jgi:hypothetical protein
MRCTKRRRSDSTAHGWTCILHLRFTIQNKQGLLKQRQRPRGLHLEEAHVPRLALGADERQLHHLSAKVTGLAQKLQGLAQDFNYQNPY